MTTRSQLLLFGKFIGQQISVSLLHFFNTYIRVAALFSDSDDSVEYVGRFVLRPTPRPSISQDLHAASTSRGFPGQRFGESRQTFLNNSLD